jgi:hypothetical protein
LLSSTRLSYVADAIVGDRVMDGDEEGHGQG